MKLVQNSLFEKFSFELAEDGVKMFFKNSEGEFENFLHFEDISIRQSYQIIRNSKLLYASIVFAVIALIVLSSYLNDGGVKFSTFLLYVIISLSLFLSYKVTEKSYILFDLPNNEKLFFIKNKPNNEDFNDFINELFNRRDIYLKKNYLDINFDINPKYEIEKFRWLKNEEVISEEEFNIIKNELMKS